LPDASTKKSAASPFSLIFQSMTPGPGVCLGVAPGACVNLIFVPFEKGPKTAALPVSSMKISGDGSRLSETLSR
jgi:hypothetical protein